MARRQYYGAATPTTITGSITTSSSSVAIAAYTGWPTGSFSLVIDPGLSSEEKILATSQTTGTITFTTRGYDGTTASAHNAGAVIYPVPTAIDFDEANAVTTKYSATGDLTYASAANTPATLSIGATNNQLAVIGGIPAWIASPDVPKSTVTAKGDIITATASGTPSNLAVGSDGQTLVADSSTSTGLRYQSTMAAGKNSAINGGMDIWQRNTTVAGSTTAFTADRWQAYRSVAGSTFSRQSAGLTGFNYGMRIQRDSGNASTILIQTLQNYETVNTIPLAGQTVTLSWYAKAGANFSATSSQMFAQVYTGTGTDQNVLSGYTGSVGLLSAAVTITTSYVRYSQTFTIGSTATEMAIVFGFNPTGTASTNDWVEITGVQLEVGSVATTFTRTGGTFQGELAACQRYLPAIPTGTTGGALIGFSQNTTRSFVVYSFPVQARVAPTGITIPALSNFTLYNALIIGGTPTAIAFNSASTTTGLVYVDATAGAPTQVAGQSTLLAFTNASAYILFTGCEL